MIVGADRMVDDLDAGSDGNGVLFNGAWQSTTDGCLG
jgi:hypothetical protein